jgi:hypothetical protein
MQDFSTFVQGRIQYLKEEKNEIMRKLRNACGNFWGRATPSFQPEYFAKSWEATKK